MRLFPADHPLASGSRPYLGRFAPTPSGYLHFGSLIAALGSFLDARTHGGRWLIRIEDLDTPRNQPGAAAAILRSLEAHGLLWDGAVTYQNQRLQIYQSVLRDLTRGGHIFPCGCTRAELADASDGVYPGTCRQGLADGKTARSQRLRLPDELLQFTDRALGAQQQNLRQQAGDTILKRADGIIAYHLAVVVDDAAQGITDVVRGEDLLDSTPRQIYLQQLLGYATPRYLHVPLALGADGRKLSKQNGASALDDKDPLAGLTRAADFLGIKFTETPANISEYLSAATQKWRQIYLLNKQVALASLP